MKKFLTLILVLLMAVFTLAACGGSSDEGADTPDTSEPVSVDSLKTFGDVIDLEKEDVQSAVGGGYVVYAFKYGDTYYRVKSAIPADLEEEYIGIDILEDGYEEKQQALISDVEIDEIENLSEQILSSEECDALVGKTGQEMQDAGWKFGDGHSLESMEFWANYGPFTYTVVFDGEVPESEYETFDDVNDTKDMKVKSVEFMTLGDATTIE
jgi:hypothetical protein